MLVVSACYDFTFSLVEIVQQHELVIKNGIMFIIPKGIENMINHEICPLFFFPHLFLCSMGCFILPAQYHYRYKLLTE
ncbi:unnamed protein product [Bursaphelenchus okinawaensis]|uniref:Uncharacterized protein n=1 Tax=Bursaphelenchus okinawaensis TaxID=465554 RepID=A0A811KBZ1_9BILA|nr:unnamed protein product [Bursaphelenchus okinawaensis]CAG9100582.1 unnamed protein product [Bursaphelenchus okinawaensis]